MKRIGAVLLAIIFVFALAAPAAAQAPANVSMSSSWGIGPTWTTITAWLGGLADGVLRAVGASSEPSSETQAFPEIDPDGFTTQLNPELDPDGSTTNAFPEIDPDG